VIPWPPKIIHNFPWPHISAGQRRIQFCTLLQISVRLYCDSRSRNSFTTSLHLQLKCSCTATTRKKRRNGSLAEATFF
jgi:hypothetical protein